MTKRILYISYDGLTDPLGQSQIIPYLTKLSHLRYSITILSFEKRKANIALGPSVKKHLEQSGIAWMPLMYTKRPPVLSTLLDMIRMHRAARRIFAENRIEITHCRSYIPGLVGMAIRHSFGVPFIFDMRGLWPDERVESGLWNIRNPIFKLVYRYFKRKERQLLDEASHIITLTNSSVPVLKSLSSKKDLPITVIPTCVDQGFFEVGDVGSSELRRQLGLEEDSFVLLYAGSLGRWYMLREMLFFFSILLKRNPKSKFIILTNEISSEIFKWINDYQVPRDTVLIETKKRDDIPIYISICNWAIFFIKPLSSKIASCPTKFAEIISKEKPVLCNGGVGDLRELYESYELGLCIDSFDFETLDKSADYVLKNSSKESDKRVVDDFFSLDKAVSVIAQTYEALLSQKI